VSDTGVFGVVAIVAVIVPVWITGVVSTTHITAGAIGGVVVVLLIVPAPHDTRVVSEAIMTRGRVIFCMRIVLLYKAILKRVYK
jgi:hypothetical protein